MARRGNLLAFSTRASLLAQTEAYDLEYFAEYILHGYGPPDRTAFRDVEAVRSAEVVTWTSGTLRRQSYWEPPAGESTIAEPGSVIVATFGQLLSDAVSTSLTGAPNVWSHLTGGMDSSSVVGVAQTLAARGEVTHGLAGVVTYQADPPLGSDVDHARLVAERYGLQHEVLDGWRVWDDDGSEPPLLDQPAYEQANYAIERRLANTIAARGGQILLTGVGGDLYLRPQFDRASDLLARGRVREAITYVAQWAIASRKSFWSLLAQHGLYPLLPAAGRYALGKPEFRVPDWIPGGFSRSFDLRSRTVATKTYAGPWGAKSGTLITEALRTHASRVGQERIGETNLEWRHPLLHRPLVEYGMRLPQEWLVATGTDLSKRVLREAMRGVLPEPVRLRRGKGGLQPDTHNALTREASRFARIVKEPLLAELRCLDATRFSHAVTEPARSRRPETYLINNALTLELWLRRRLDRLP